MIYGNKVNGNKNIIATVGESQLTVKCYDDLLQKPKINGIEINNEKEGNAYGLLDLEDEITNEELEELFK